MKPKVTVLMPVYNCRTYIEESVNSILNQTFTDFEFLIIDDCSTDGTFEYLQSLSDLRIHLIRKTQNTGLTNSLNMGLKIAQGVYIARMDGDDISLPDRFAKQVDFMEKNPDIILCGSRTQVIGTNKIYYVPDDHERIKINLILGGAISHPTVMMRNSAMKKFKLEYDPELEPAEDYDLWTRMIFFGKLANLNEVLLLYRVHDNQTSSIRKQSQIKNEQKIKRRMLQHLIPEMPIKYELFELKNALVKSELSSREEIERLKERLIYMDKIVFVNNNKKIYNPELFLQFIISRKGDLPELFFQNSKTNAFRTFTDILFFMPHFFYNIGLRSSIRYTTKFFLKVNKYWIKLVLFFFIRIKNQLNLQNSCIQK